MSVALHLLNLLVLSSKLLAEPTYAGVNMLSSPLPDPSSHSSSRVDLMTCERQRLQDEELLTIGLMTGGGGLGYGLPYLWSSGYQRAGSSVLGMLGGMALGYATGLIWSPSWIAPCDERGEPSERLLQAMNLRESHECGWQRNTYLISITAATAFAAGVGAGAVAKKAYPSDDLSTPELFGVLLGIGAGALGGYLLGDWLLKPCGETTSR